MSISYPLSVPSRNWRTFKLSGQNAVALATSPFTYQQQVQAFAGDRWRLEVTLPKIKDRPTAEAWHAFLLALRGPYGYFEAGDPLCGAPMGSVTGAPLVNGAHSAGARTLAVNALTASTTGLFLPGDQFQVTLGFVKYLHKVLEQVDSNGAGEASIEIWPALRAAAADNTPLVYASPQGTWRLESGVDAELDANYLRIYELSFSAVEYLPIG